MQDSEGLFLKNMIYSSKRHEPVNLRHIKSKED